MRPYILLWKSRQVQTATLFRLVGLDICITVICVAKLFVKAAAEFDLYYWNYSFRKLFLIAQQQQFYEDMLCIDLFTGFYIFFLWAQGSFWATKLPCC